VNTSRHLDSHIVRITLFLPRALLNDPLLERLSYLLFELPPLCSSNFGAPRFRYGASLRGLSPNEIILGFIFVAYLKKMLGRGPLALHGANGSNKWEAENATQFIHVLTFRSVPGSSSTGQQQQQLARLQFALVDRHGTYRPAPRSRPCRSLA
jgi:hypothetical protein